MHRTKKMLVTMTAIALLMASGVSSAMAERNNDKVTICHATGSATNPFVRINVSENSNRAHGHAQHEGDVNLGEDNANTKQCPTTQPPNGEDHDVTICHYIASSDSYQRIHVAEDSAEAATHDSHIDDVISRDDANRKQCPANGDDEDSESCSASSTSGNSTAEQDGLVNVGNVNVNAANLAANALCQSSILNNLTASVLGSSVGGSSFGSGLLTGGLGGLLSGLTTDVNVLANVLVIF